MDFSLLKNTVYLYLLVFYNGKQKPSFSQLSREIDFSRQTISKKIQDLKDQDLLTETEEGEYQVTNPLNIDIDQLKDLLLKRVYNPAVLIQELGLLDTDKPVTNTEIIKKCKISKGTFYNNKKATGTFIYGIVVDKQLKYIGSTDNLPLRIDQHIKKRPQLTEDNFIILSEIDLNGRYAYELSLIHLLQPEWNVMGKETDI